MFLLEYIKDVLYSMNVTAEVLLKLIIMVH